MPLNLQNINNGIYFEFYLNDNLFFRYNYDPLVLEISMFSLCEYITKDILKHYKYKKFTGSKYNCKTILSFSLLLHKKPIVADIDQSINVSDAYPLDVNLSQQAFSINLYMNILVLLCNEIESDSYLIELEIWKAHLQRHSQNVLWCYFPNFNSSFDNKIRRIINNKKIEINNIIANYQLSNVFIEKYIQNLSTDIESLQSNSYNILDCFEVVSSNYLKCIRLSKYSNQAITTSTLKKHLEIPNIKNEVYLNYIYGNFKSLTNDEFVNANKMMALRLFIHKNTNLEDSLSYLNYIQAQIVKMQSKKTEIINHLYDLQEQVINIWQK